MPQELPPVPGVEHDFVSAGGLRTHIAHAGEGPPLLLLHGWPQHWWMWRDLIGPLSETHRVICPDLRGFGWTAAPPGGYDPEIFALDLIALLDALEIEGAVDIAGHDWGGWTAQMLGILHPERVRSVVALNIYHPFITPSPRRFLSLWRFWYQWVVGAPGLGPTVMRRAVGSSPVIRWVGSSQAPWSEEESQTYLEQFRDPARAEAASLLYRHAVTMLPRKVMGGRYRALGMRAPGLYLFGTADRVQKADAMPGFEPYAPGMRLELVEGVGHFIVDERPKLVLERIRQTIDSAPD